MARSIENPSNVVEQDHERVYRQVGQAVGGFGGSWPKRQKTPCRKQTTIGLNRWLGGDRRASIHAMAIETKATTPAEQCLHLKATPY